MRFISLFSFLSLLFIVPLTHAEEGRTEKPAPRKCVFNPKWTHCKSDADCTVVPGVCGFWDGFIHKKYRAQAGKYYQCEGAAAGCVEPTLANNPKPQVKCMAGTCMKVVRESEKFLKATPKAMAPKKRAVKKKRMK